MASEKILIRGGTLIDGNGGAPVKGGAILIEEDRISTVGSRREVEKGLELRGPGAPRHRG